MPLSALHAALETIPASAIMTGPVRTAYERWPLTRLVEFFMEHGITGAPVLALDGTLVGVVSVSDVLRAGRPEAEEACSAPPTGHLRNAGFGYELGRQELAQLLKQVARNGLTVGEVMTRAVIQVEADTPLLDALCLMQAKRIHRVFVVKSGRVLGVISNGSLLAGLVGARASIAA
jgi:CBS domain-containing protein